jgi:hypothetical protein
MLRSNAAYAAGKHQALLKLGFVRRALVGGTLGGIAGHTLAPEDRKGQGTMLGAALTAAGAAGGPAVAHLSDDIPKPLAALLGGTAGLGLSQAMIDKNMPDQSEDPYRYFPR